MPQFSFTGVISFNPTSVLSSQEVIDHYLQGINLSYKNKTVSAKTIDYYIDSSQKWIERVLSIKLNRQLVEESQDLYYENWQSWNLIQTNLPVVCPKKLEGFLGPTKVTEYPLEWMSAARNSDPQSLPPRQIRLVPNRGGIAHYNGYMYTGYSMYSFSMMNGRQVPNYWTLGYVTGWLPGKIPQELVNVIGKLAAVYTIASVGEIQLPLIGVTSQSLSLDGLSQTLSSAAGNQHPFSARLKSYNEQLTNDFKILLQLYKQPYMSVF